MGEIYFGHPLDTFDTELEDDLVDAIETYFSDGQVENPNQQEHIEAYEQWKAEKNDGMAYYFEEVLPAMEKGVFLPFEDGKYGAGTAAEAEFLDDRDRPVYEIDYDGEIHELDVDDIDALSVEETRERLGD